MIMAFFTKTFSVLESKIMMQEVFLQNLFNKEF